MVWQCSKKGRLTKKDCQKFTKQYGDIKQEIFTSQYSQKFAYRFALIKIGKRNQLLDISMSILAVRLITTFADCQNLFKTIKIFVRKQRQLVI